MSTIPCAVVILVFQREVSRMQYTVKTRERKCGEIYICCDVCVCSFYEITQQRLFVFLAVL